MQQVFVYHTHPMMLLKEILDFSPQPSPKKRLWCMTIQNLKKKKKKKNTDRTNEKQSWNNFQLCFSLRDSINIIDPTPRDENFLKGEYHN